MSDRFRIPTPYGPVRPDSPMASPAICELPGSPMMQIPVRPAKRMSRMMTPKRFLAIGIDFGTTYSGVSWAYSEDPENINVITSWPAKGYSSTDEQQVPTRFNMQTGDWGYMIGKDSHPLRWFKLLLLDNKDIKSDVQDSEALRDARAQLGCADRQDVVRLIGQYLKAVWDHALEEIKCQINANDLNDLPFKVAITIPAIWPQYARKAMKDAAGIAGILERRDIGETVFMLVEEPEAAAIATLVERKKYPDIKEGESFVVCDCGGGTVDIISYKVKSIDPFQVEEVVVGDGKLCGAFMVDDSFEKWMSIKSGLKFKNCDEQEFRRFVDEQWEFTLKRKFNGREASDFDVRPPQRAFSYRKRIGGKDLYRIPRASIKQFYARSLAGVKELLSKQVSGVRMNTGKPPKTILLVGGLGSSRYIFNELNDMYGNVLQPTKPWSAVARGATIKLLRHTMTEPNFVPGPRQVEYLSSLPAVSVRMSKLSYGVESGVPVTRCYPPVDPTVDRVTTDPDGTKVVWRMRWYLKKGERVDNKNPVAMGFYEFVDGPSKSKSVFSIASCGDDPPPVRKGASVSALCEIECEYDTPFLDLPKVANTRFRRMDGMKLTMRIEGETHWSLQIGKNTAEKEVKVEYAS